MLKIILLPLLLTLSLFSGSLSITGTVVSDNQKMIGARFMGYVKNIYSQWIKRDKKIKSDKAMKELVFIG